jgi:hypothetical protein
MRYAGNFHPEWGYLAPAPGFMRSARVAVVATAIGATAGAGVVLSLVDRPAETSVAARTLVRPVEAAAPSVVGPSARPLAQAPSERRPAAPTLVLANTSAEGAPGSESRRGATALAATRLVEAPAATDDAVASAASEVNPTLAPAAADASAAHKKAKAKRSISRDSWRDDSWRGGPLAILPGQSSMRGASRWADRDAWGGYDFEGYRYR